MNITILCKVVDNYGDIGVVYRMAKELLLLNNKEKYYENLKINIVIDDLVSFNKINNRVLVSSSYQKVDGFYVYDSNDEKVCYDAFSKNDGEEIGVILECFQCGRPNWLEKILFEDKLNHTVNIIMIDYLTAEKYAEDFHLLDSLTRSAKVQKVNFMPGFTDKTGGLVIEEEWKNWILNGQRKVDNSVFVFTYKKNWAPLVKALKDTGKKVIVAQGQGKDSFIENCEKEKYINSVTELGFINQEEWDKTMQNSSLLFIRGEESMSRACLSGIPFVWHAYPQSDEYQMVKVNALLDRMSRHFKNEDFSIIKELWLDFNLPESEISEEKFYKDSLSFINNADRLEYGFKEFSKSLLKNGDLCASLMTFIRKKDIL